ncbi:receptor expression-enhancing protein 1 isoform X2 [Chelonia mydas]|uniref:receptor expression-enhancing protein 1 isoform X2 n=1 Tax=Chelonia mydas TaxID=8469 RepID=UPI0018A1C33A|nr:receptor expression-enhancing protein 1 isoform X2 [Chelonia mydas]
MTLICVVDYTYVTTCCVTPGKALQFSVPAQQGSEAFLSISVSPGSCGWAELWDPQVKWMMYWIIFALFTTAETFTDLFLCWFPFYYELKIAFVAWLLSPYTKGSSLLYRKFVHPTLSSKEKEIDDCLVQAKDRSYDALVHFGKRGLNVAATAAVMAASKGQGALSERLRSFSMQDLSTIRGDSSSPVPPPVTVRTSSKQSKPKTSRSASESTGSSVCSCCSVCRILRGTA